MNDKDIIKAVECCLFQEDCTECPLCDDVDCCEGYMLKKVFDLISRQQAEIEKMSKELKITRDYIHYNNLEYDLLSYSKRNGG